MHRGRNTAAVFGSIALVIGFFLMAAFGQTRDQCGAITAPTDAQCNHAELGFYFGAGLLILAVALIIGAFILTVAEARPADPPKKAPPGWYRAPGMEPRWWDGERWAENATLEESVHR